MFVSRGDAEFRKAVGGAAVYVLSSGVSTVTSFFRAGGPNRGCPSAGLEGGARSRGICVHSGNSLLNSRLAGV